MAMVQSTALFWVSVTVTESPGFTDSDTGRDDEGSISVQASYATSPPLTVACVPAWMRSFESMPPIPTHVASAPDVVASTVGTVHVPVTDVKLPPVAEYPDQFDDVDEVAAGTPGLAGSVRVCGAGCAAVG